jgi:hypothetical protein
VSRFSMGNEYPNQGSVKCSIFFLLFFFIVIMGYSEDSFTIFLNRSIQT